MSFFEILRSFLETQTVPIGDLAKLQSSIAELYRADKLLANPSFELFSASSERQEALQSEGFSLFSDRIMQS